MLSELTLRGFRNLRETVWSPAGGRNLILGDNGAGKTSLLEAVYLLATTRSFRTSQVSDCIRHGEEGFHLKGEVESGSRSTLEVAWSEGRRQRRLNGAGVSLSEHVGALPVVAWTAAEAAILSGPPAARRRLLDQGAVSIKPATLETLSRFRRALEQKRRLLAQGASGLAAWNEVLAEAVAELALLRRDYLQRLEVALGEVWESGGLDLPAVEMVYRPSPPEAEEGAGAVLARLEEAEGRERQRQRPLIGSHLDEMDIRWGGREVRRVASGGERKILGLALVAARGRLLEGLDRAPVYLIDDGDSELDRGRLAALSRLFSGAGQLLLCSSRPEAWEGVLEASRWRLESGFLSSR